MSKRFKFWLETVPEDVRRLEYGLWKRRRKLLHANLFHFQKQQEIKSRATPIYTREQERIDWQTFADSFLFGEERSTRFREAITTARKDIPKIRSLYIGDIPEERILAVALWGSSVYGPRKADAPLSDIDVAFLLDGNSTYDIKPEKAMADLGKPYHVLATGTKDEFRGDLDFHWLLLPHYLLHTKLSPEELKRMITSLVSETMLRKDDLARISQTLDSEMEKRHTTLPYLK